VPSELRSDCARCRW